MVSTFIDSITNNIPESTKHLYNIYTTLYKCYTNVLCLPGCHLRYLLLSGYSKHETFTQCWYNVGSASQTLGQHCTKIGWMVRACCRITSYIDRLIDKIYPSKNGTNTFTWLNNRHKRHSNIRHLHWFSKVAGVCNSCMKWYWNIHNYI